MVHLHCWIIIGPNNVRKGSTIRSITGISQKKEARVSLLNGQWLELGSVQISSINEKTPVPSPDDWLAGLIPAKKAGRMYFIFPLRHDAGAPGPGLHNARPYVEALVQASATIESIVVLSGLIPDWVPPLGVPFGRVPDSENTPTSVTVKQVRQFWGWE